jgi:hypothetical protein
MKLFLVQVNAHRHHRRAAAQRQTSQTAVRMIEAAFRADQTFGENGNAFTAF